VKVKKYLEEKNENYIKEEQCQMDSFIRPNNFLRRLSGCIFTAKQRGSR
jgi:hypothetical protein